MDDIPYPTWVFCIIIAQFCERFSFCGLRTILSIYLRNELLFRENTATIIYHSFIVGCYLIPVIVAFFIENVLSRYRTILYFSAIYLLGNILLCLSTIPPLNLPPIECCFIGLLLISIGCGGIKPYIAVFGGDQFRLPQQIQLLQKYFSLFYLTINLGGCFGMIVMPILKKWVSCFGDDTCYSVAFGLSAVLMLLSLLVFMMGKRWYRIKRPKDNITMKFLKCAQYVLKQDTNRDEFSRKFIKDTKRVLSLLIIFLPLPIFWSLFDQQGSRWTFQATHMNYHIYNTQIIPDQMQIINPALVIILIPIFDKIHKILIKYELINTCLERMVIGGVFAGFSFITAGILELFLQGIDMPQDKQTSINLINTINYDLDIAVNFEDKQRISVGTMIEFKDLPCNDSMNYQIQFYRAGFNRLLNNFEITTHESYVTTVLIGMDQNDQIEIFMFDYNDLQKSLNGKAQLKVVLIRKDLNLNNLTLSFMNHDGFEDIYYMGKNLNASLILSPYLELSQGLYNCKISTQENLKIYEDNFDLLLGGVYLLVIRDNYQTIEFLKLFTLSLPNTVNILWILPQYILISIGDILFSIGGIEFSLTQAPKSMKIIIIAFWYLNVAIGNFIVILITQINVFQDQAQEFFFFALLMTIDMMIFVVMVANYRFIQPEPDSSTSFILNY